MREEPVKQEVVTMVPLTDLQLLAVSNGLIGELARVAKNGNLGSVKMTVALLEKLQPNVDQAIERLNALSPKPEQPIQS